MSPSRIANRETILIVHGDQGAREGLCTFADVHECDAVAVGSLEEALYTLEATPSVIVLGLMRSPGGETLLQQLCDWAEGRDIPVVVVTSCGVLPGKFPHKNRASPEPWFPRTCPPSA